MEGKIEGGIFLFGFLGNKKGTHTHTQHHHHHHHQLPWLPLFLLNAWAVMQTERGEPHFMLQGIIGSWEGQEGSLPSCRIVWLARCINCVRGCWTPVKHQAFAASRCQEWTCRRNDLIRGSFTRSLQGLFSVSSQFPTIISVLRHQREHLLYMKRGS